MQESRRLSDEFSKNLYRMYKFSKKGGKVDERKWFYLHSFGWHWVSEPLCLSDRFNGVNFRSGGADPSLCQSGRPGGCIDYGYYNVRAQDKLFQVDKHGHSEGARVRIRFREAATLVGQGLCNGATRFWILISASAKVMYGRV